MSENLGIADGLKVTIDFLKSTLTQKEIDLLRLMVSGGRTTTAEANDDGSVTVGGERISDGDLCVALSDKLSKSKYVSRASNSPSFFLTSKGRNAAFSPRFTFRTWTSLAFVAAVMSALSVVATGMANSDFTRPQAIGPPGNVPIGTILAWNKNIGGVGELSLPSGWLLCNGQSITRKEYPAVFAGVGQGRNTLFLPDLNGAVKTQPPDAPRDWIWGAGLFLRGGQTSNVFQQDAFKKHNHDLSDPGHTHKIAASICAAAGQHGLRGESNPTELPPCPFKAESLASKTGISIAPAGTEEETRPKNMSVVWIIRVGEVSR